MANPKSRVLPQILNVYLFILFAHCYDVFDEKLMGDSKALGTNFYGHFAGLLVIFVACLVKKISGRKLGIDLRPKRILKGLWRGAVFSLVPIAIVVVLMFLVHAVTGWEWARVRFLPPNINYSPFGIAGSAAVYGGCILISVFLKELFFREYVITQARPVYSFSDANLIQAALCVPLPLFNHFKNIVYGKYADMSGFWMLMISIAAFYVVHEFLTAIKWGMLARVSKDIWLVFFDHYFYNFIGFCFLFSQSKISGYDTMFKLLAVQGISFLMTLVYYRKKRAEKEQKEMARKMEIASGERQRKSEKLVQKRNEMHAEKNAEILENFDPNAIRSTVDTYASASGHHHHHHHHHHQKGKNAPDAAKGAAEDSSAKVLENVSDGQVDQLIGDYKSDYMKSMGTHTRRHRQHKERPKDEKLMDLNEININDFYKEYAKETERAKRQKHEKYISEHQDQQPEKHTGEHQDQQPENRE